MATLFLTVLMCHNFETFINFLRSTSSKFNVRLLLFWTMNLFNHITNVLILL
jgi:hypothetical protein